MSGAGWIKIARHAFLAFAAAAFSGACQPASHERDSAGEAESTRVLAQKESSAAQYARQRATMVAEQLRPRDITDPRVLEAMARVQRHRFVPPTWRSLAYTDGPLPIGHDQTISQPYIVALMTQLAQPEPGDRVLDVGTGSGYQAAVLAEIVGQVYSVEIICPLADAARRLLQDLDYQNVEVRCGDGYRGWPEQAPFDLIILAAAPDHVPQPLVEQLVPGGRLVLPVGETYQDLVVVEKQLDRTIRQWRVLPVRFVPMTGESQRRAGGSEP
jgi:protein-L-isoaspartate(D-aspartate) O-methyltransferase